MKTNLTLLVAFIATFFYQNLQAQAPANPNATPAAVALLQKLYALEGKGILTGMHNEQENPTEFTQILMSKNGNVEPGLWGNDYRYGTYIQWRQRVTDEAIRQWNDGKVVTMLYHAPRPMDPVDAGWTSVQGEVTSSEWNDIITPGTSLYNQWLNHVDLVAGHMKQLKDAGVVVLFKPYHEMNGDWFWYGQKSTYAQLWRNLYNRYVNHHGLNNILWVFNVNWSTNMSYIQDPGLFYPGDAYVDVLATDNYSRPWDKAEYDRLKAVGNSKPVAIGECELLPPLDQFKAEGQNYVWFMGWRQLFLDKNTNTQFQAAFANSYAVNADDNFLASENPNPNPGNCERGRIRIGQSGLYKNTLITDQGTLLRGGTVRIKKSKGYAFAVSDVPWDEAIRRRFNVMRVTCDYRPHLGSSETYTLDEYVDYIDQVVDQAAERGMYVVIDHHNDPGFYSLSASRDFWNRIAPRYANRTHVIYELTNEPVGWSPGDYTSSNLRDFEEIYRLVRNHAPQTHLVLLTFAVASSGMTNVVNQMLGIDWSNASVGFHSYHITSSSAIQDLKNNYPCFNTEFELPETTGNAKNLDGFYYHGSRMEQLGISWMQWDIMQSNSEISDNLPRVISDLQSKGVYWTADDYSKCGTSSCTPVTLPGKVEAENWCAMSGVQTQATTDTGGGQNVGYIQAGDFMNYSINVPSAGTYQVSFRVAALTNNIRFQLKKGSTVLTTVDELATGGWQTWKTVTKTVTLAAGEQELTIAATGDSWNINWFSFANSTTSDIPYHETFDSQGGTFSVSGSSTKTWSSPVLNIATAGSVNVSMDLIETGSLDPEGSYRDYLNVYYKLNGGSNVAIAQINGASGQTAITANGISGNTLQIIVEATTTAIDERYQIDNVRVNSGSQSVTRTLNPTEDSYVEESVPATNNGSATYVEIKGDPANYDREGYLKFNINGITNITEAKLRLYCTYTTGGTIDHSIFGVNNDSWSESGITWNNAPGASTSAIGTLDVSTINRYYEWDVTSYVAAQTDGNVSLMIANAGKDMARVRFGTKESSFKPELVVKGTAVQSSVARMMTNTDESIFESELDSKELVCYPNPSTNGVFNVRGSSLQEKAAVMIYDGNGKVLFSKTLNRNNQHEFQVKATLNPGIYYMVCKSGNVKLNKILIIQ